MPVSLSPSLLEINVIRLPSGDQTGFLSDLFELIVNLLISRLSMLITYISSLFSVLLAEVKAISLPLGDHEYVVPGLTFF